jgi:type III pantothenate kinase
MRLLIDLGNTRLKWAAADPGWKVGAAVFHGRATAEFLDDIWQALPAPSVVAMVSVTDRQVSDAIVQWVHERWRIDVRQARSQPEQLGVTNCYRDPGALGADRWVALVGARAIFANSSVCVVDCGTAVTIDALTAGGEFAGGIIFPGLRLLRQSLTANTAHIRDNEGDELSCLARATGDAVAAGTLYGLAGAIERVCNEFEQNLGESMKLVITGGDGDRLAAHLHRPVRRIPDLVLRGLDRIMQAS